MTKELLKNIEEKGCGCYPKTNIVCSKHEVKKDELREIARDLHANVISVNEGVSSFSQIATAERKAGREEMVEIVICSGIKLKDGRVLRCHRHGDGMLNAHRNGWKLFDGIEQQGFVTSKGRYVSRKEGRILQDKAGIPSADKGGYRADTLFSEDLY